MEHLRQTVPMIIPNLISGLESFGGAMDNMYVLTEYTLNAVSEGRWEDASRGMSGLALMNYILEKETKRIAGDFVIGAVTAPFRNAWEFGTAARETFQGKRSGWDLMYHALILTADVLSLGVLYKK